MGFKSKMRKNKNTRGLMVQFILEKELGKEWKEYKKKCIKADNLIQCEYCKCYYLKDNIDENKSFKDEILEQQKIIEETYDKIK